MKRRLLIFGVIGVLLVFLAAVALLFLLKRPSNSNNNSPTNSFQERQSKTECKKKPIFTREFTDFSKIQAFQPIGSITGASRGRSYITIQKGGTVPVYLPVDATMFAIVYAYRGPDAPKPEYGFWFEVGCGYTLLLDHLDSATDEVIKYAPKEASRSSEYNSNLSVPLKAGTLLGHSDGTPQARTFDFLVMDRNNQVNYINPARWTWEQSLYSVCPYDLFTEVLKEKYYQKVGQPLKEGLKKSSSCGQLSYDIAGTVSGGWFLTENATDMQGEFLLVGEIDGAVYVVVKNSSENRLAGVNDYNPPKLPKNVKVGEEVCYKSGTNSWFYLILLSETSLNTNSGTGTCPAKFPTNNTKIYTR